MSIRAGDLLSLSAIAIALTLIIAAPVLRGPSERVFGAEIVGRHHDPFTVMQQFERPLAIGAYLQPLTDIPGVVLARVIHPITTYNLLVVLTFPLSAIAAYLLARHLGLSWGAGNLAALAFAFSPFHVAHSAYHLHIAQTQWIPLYLLALLRCVDAATPVAVGVLVLAVAGVTLSNFYGGFIAAAITPFALAGYWFNKPRRHHGASADVLTTILVLGIMASAGIGYVWFAAAPVMASPESFAFARDELFRYSARGWSYLVPPMNNPVLAGLVGEFWRSESVTTGLLEQQVSLGWGLVALALVAIVAWSCDAPRTTIVTVPVLGAVAVVAWVFSLSPEVTIGALTFRLPSAYLYDLLPMFRAYARFGVVVQLMVALLAAVGAERLWRAHGRVARPACAVLVLLVIVEYAVWPPALWRDVLPTAAHRWIVEQPDPVHALDCAAVAADATTVGWLSNHRITPRHGALDDCDEPNISEKLAANGYTHVLTRNVSGLHRSWGPRAGFRSAARFADSEALAVVTPPPVVYTEQVTAFYPRESTPSRTWRWMSDNASWTVANASRDVVVATLEIEMAAFKQRRNVALRLDGVDVQTLPVDERRSVVTIGPMTLWPGLHLLTFHAMEPATVAHDVLNNGDRRPLSFAVDSWRWRVESVAR